MKLLLTLITVSLFGLSIVDCGATDKAQDAPSTASTAVASTAKSPVEAPSSLPSALIGLKGDEDDDDNGEKLGTTKYDTDSDYDNDYKRETKGYYDSDDRPVSAYGHAADAAEARTLGALAHRYYAAAAAGNGQLACSAMDRTFENAVPEDFGRSPPAPAYMQGKTCARVMSLLFKHSPGTKEDPVIAGARIKGNQAYVLVGFKHTPASYLTFRSNRGQWGMVELLSTRLP